VSGAAAVIVAAGEGRRFGGPKQFALLGGRSILEHCVERFESHGAVETIVLVLPGLPSDGDLAGQDIGEDLARRFRKVAAVVAGGPRRQDSVRNGFGAVRGSGRDVVLMTPKNFTQTALGAVAQHGVAHGRGRGHDANPPCVRRSGVSGAWAGGRNNRCRAPETPQGEGAAIDTASLLPDGAEIALATQMLLRAETHGGRGRTRAGRRRGGQTTVRRFRPLRRRALMTLRPLAVDMRAR